MSNVTPDSSNIPPSQAQLSIWRRIVIAFGAFFRIIANAPFAESVERLSRPAAAAAPVLLRESNSDAALQLLTLLQRDARLVDFAQESIEGYSDADIGAAVRPIHQGFRKVLRDYFTIEPIRSEIEGTRITLNEGFDASTIRLCGRVVGAPPFVGPLCHRGWRATNVRLPKLSAGHDVTVLAQAEVEL
jgi:hypothetical protein